MSSYANARCACGRKMSCKVEVVRGTAGKETIDGVFLKAGTRFIITDNLTVTPSFTKAAFNLLRCADSNNSTVVERQVSVGLSEIIAILHQSLISEAALSNVFLVRENYISLEKKNNGFVLVSHPERSSDPSQDNIAIKLIVDKQANKVLYAECNQDFIDILFSFLTYPSGFVINRLNEKSHITCLDNLYASVLNKTMADCFKTYEGKEYLVNPKLPKHYRLSKSLIKSDEVMPERYYMCRTPHCNSDEVSLIPNVHCKCLRITNKRMKITDPRSGTNRSINEGFVSEGIYIVTDDLVVTPLTLMIANAIEGVEEIPVNVGEKEVVALLEAILGSESVLTDSFLVKEETAIN